MMIKHQVPRMEIYIPIEAIIPSPVSDLTILLKLSLSIDTIEMEVSSRPPYELRKQYCGYTVDLLWRIMHSYIPRLVAKSPKRAGFAISIQLLPRWDPMDLLAIEKALNIDVGLALSHDYLESTDCTCECCCLMMNVHSSSEAHSETSVSALATAVKWSFNARKPASPTLGA